MTPAPGDDQKADDVNRNSAVEAEAAEIAEEEVENADGATDAENVSDEAAPGDDEVCGDGEGTENLSHEGGRGIRGSGRGDR